MKKLNKIKTFESFSEKNNQQTDFLDLFIDLLEAKTFSNKEKKEALGRLYNNFKDSLDTNKEGFIEISFDIIDSKSITTKEYKGIATRIWEKFKK